MADIYWQIVLFKRTERLKDKKINFPFIYKLTHNRIIGKILMYGGLSLILLIVFLPGKANADPEKVS